MRVLAKGLLCLSLSAVLAGTLAAELCSRTQMFLSADAMDYDSKTGDFAASGHVKLTREALSLTAPQGKANSQTQKARLWGGVHAFGLYQGQKLDAKCDVLEADFAAPGGSYRMSGGVDALFGTRELRSSTAAMAGQRFNAEEVSRFYDSERKLLLKCKNLHGDYNAEGLNAFTAVGSVYLKQLDAENKSTEIWCDTLVYSRIQDTMHASGNARALQDGRRLSAKELIYYPSTGKLEAKGLPRISVDLNAMKSSPKKTPAAPASSPRGTRASRKDGKK